MEALPGERTRPDRRRQATGRGRVGGGGGGDVGHDLLNHRSGRKDVDVIAICNADPTVTEEGRDSTKPRVEAEGKELCSERVALPGATARDDHRRLRLITPHIELCGATVARLDPLPEPREALPNDSHEVTPVHRVEGVATVKRNVNPIRVLIQDCSDGVGGKLKPRAARYSNLGRPRCTIGLGGLRRSRGRRLEVGGKAEAVLGGSHHGDGAG